MSSKYRIIPLGGGGMDPSTKYGASISMSMDQDYILSVQLLDQDGNALGSEQTVDLPLESVVVGGSYDSATKSLILTLDNGDTVTIPVGDLVSGLQTEITAQNPLSADLVADGTNNKVFTAADDTKLSGIEAGAQVNVKPDWTAAAGTAAEILNKPTIPTKTSDLSNDSGFITLNDVPAQVNADWNASSGAAEILNKPTIPAAANDATITVHQDGQADQTFTLNQSGDQTINIAAGGGGNAWYGTQEQFDALGTYDEDTDYFITDKLDYSEIKNTPKLSAFATKAEVNAKNDEQDNTINGKMSAKFMTQAEFDALGQNLPEGDNYFIEGNTVQMVVTFQDQTTATYNVVID